MDLFGRKAEKRVADELRQVNEHLMGILRQVLSKQEEFEKIQSQFTEAQRDLAVAQEQVKFLKTQRDQLINSTPQFSPHPLHLSEEQEDANFLGNVGLMSEKDVRELLENTGFENTEVEFQ